MEEDKKKKKAENAGIIFYDSIMFLLPSKP
jgi:hypothetical protein